MSDQEFVVKMRHGNYRTYKLGCRCPRCTEAHRLNMRDLRARHRIDSRVSALLAAANAIQQASLARDLDPNVAKEMDKVATQLTRKAMPLNGPQTHIPDASYPGSVQ